MPRADVLRHVHRANVSYLASEGNGLTLTAGLFNSCIGYESFYSRNDSNYSRDPSAAGHFRQARCACASLYLLR